MKVYLVTEQCGEDFSDVIVFSSFEKALKEWNDRYREFSQKVSKYYRKTVNANTGDCIVLLDSGKYYMLTVEERDLL